MFVVDLFKLKIFTPRSLCRLLVHVLRYGIQLANVIHMSADRKSIAIKHGGETLTYEMLFRQVASIGGYVYHTHRVKQGSKVLLIADNSIPSVVLLLALSGLGCNIHIIAPMRDHDLFHRTVDLTAFDFVFSGIEEKSDYDHNAPIRYITPVWQEALRHEAYTPFVKIRTTLSIFTSGSTGIAKGAQRNNTLWQYLKAISDVVKTVRLQDYKSIILPVPIYHSYGLSVLFLGLMLHKTLFLINKFDPEVVAKDIESNRIEVAILIPQMINRLLNFEMGELRCVVSCADILPVSVLQNATGKLGNIVFNFYGTSETGLATVATPAMLAVRPDTIGRPIRGCELAIRDEEGSCVLYVRSAFAMHPGYIRTGDIATVDERGWYYLHGRADHLIVVNGVNVYPYELLQMVYKHESVQHADIKTFAGEQGFKKIRLILYTKPGNDLNEKQFKDWWVNRYGTKFLPSAVELNPEGGRIKLMQN